MKSRKLFLKAVLIFTWMFLFCGQVYAAPKLVIGKTVKTTVYTDRKVKLSVKLPSNYKNKKISWSSSNKAIGGVNKQGVFTGKKSGTVTVTAQIKGTNKKAAISVTVKPYILAQKIVIQNKKKVMYLKETHTLKAMVLPENAVSRNITWTSTKPQIASISSKGMIKAHKTGRTKIVGKVKGTKARVAFWLDVKKPVPLKSVSIRKPAKTEIVQDSTLQLSVDLLPSNTTYKELTWKANNSSIATVTGNGIVRAIRPGKVKITVTVTGTKKSASIWLVVKAKPIPATGILFSGNKPSSVEFGKSVQFHASVTPSNATNKKIVWSVSDRTKATIDQNGVLTALRPTEFVQVTAKTSDGEYAVTHTMQITANHGFLTKADLDSLGLYSIKKVMIVAHPDDETLWGGSHLLDSEYLVVVLTNGWNSTRKSDFYKAMSHTNDKCIILSYPDTKREYWSGSVWTYDTDMLSTCTKGILEDLKLILNYKKWDTVVTHNPDGEYRKYCHKMTSKFVTQIFNQSLRGKSELYYFGHYYYNADAIKGEQIPADNLEIKRKLIDFYLPTAKGAIAAFGHMIPYENWIRGDQW